MDAAEAKIAFLLNPFVVQTLKMCDPTFPIVKGGSNERQSKQENLSRDPLVLKKGPCLSNSMSTFLETFEV